MLKTIHKLVLKSFLGPLVATFFIVFFVLMMNFIWRYIDELTGKGLDAIVIIELLFYATINMIPLGLPLAMLLAAIMTMGNLGENFELQAMKSAGMSLMRIMKPLIGVAIMMSIASFFVINNLVPFAYQKTRSILYDINRQKQVLEFQDGLFFNGIDENLSIRVEHQDPETGLLNNILIYDNRQAAGNMRTTIAESGYIRLSDDKRFLLITLYNGENYEQTRNNEWYNNNSLRHDKFEVQDMRVAMTGFDFERSDDNALMTGSQSMNIVELQHAIDSLDRVVAEHTTSSYGPLLQENIFSKDIQVLSIPDSLRRDKTGFRTANLLDSLKNLDVRKRSDVWKSARTVALNSRNAFSFDETSAKDALTQLYRSKNDWHKKLSLPVSVLIFFLIGAPLGAIIRKGGLGTPIVISVIFFVFYYIISLNGEKAAKEGVWSSFSGMWLSSFVLTPIAVYLIIKATNDSSLLDTEWYYAKMKLLEEKITPYWNPIRAKITSSKAWHIASEWASKLKNKK